MGKGGGSSSTVDVRRFTAVVLFLFRGEAFLVGDSASARLLCSGSKISDGSIVSPVRVLRARAALRGVDGTVLEVRRCDCRLGLCVAAGVKSSSLLSSCFCCAPRLSGSSSSESTSTFRRSAARLEGRLGEIVAMVDQDAERVLRVARVCQVIVVRDDAMNLD